LKFYKDGVNTFTDTFQQGASMATSGSLVFGQDQDTAGGGFDTNQAFNGTMDELRIWNVVLDATTIQDWMCKKVTSNHPNYSSLIGYWQLDEESGAIVTDLSGNGNDGTRFGTTIGSSGAAIGDASTADYASPTSVNLTHSDGDDVIVDTVTGSPTGIQIYRVGSAPNITTPPAGYNELDSLRYWGVFVVEGTSPTYRISYNYDGHPGITDESSLRLASRSDGAVSSWTDLAIVPNTISKRLIATLQSGGEYIVGSVVDQPLPVELSAFSATNALGGVLLSWRTQSEIHNVGFNLYRSETKGGDDHKIAFIDGAGSTPVAHDYQFVDRAVQPGQTYYYYLEDVDAQGIANRLPEIGIEFEKPRRWKSRVITVLVQPFRYRIDLCRENSVCDRTTRTRSTPKRGYLTRFLAQSM
jgi:hypothetical protein